MLPAAHDIRLRRIYLSSFMTSLNAPGFSASLLNVSTVDRLMSSKAYDVNTYELLDAPTDAHSWLGVRRYWTDRPINPRSQESSKDIPLEELVRVENSSSSLISTPPATIRDALQSACQAVLRVERELTEYDTVAGDGDCGHTFAAGARGGYFIISCWQFLHQGLSHSVGNSKPKLQCLGPEFGGARGEDCKYT